MKIIFSRKGFDSGSGGTPSPILPDRRMVSLPIPDKQSPIRYEDIRWHEYSVGKLVSDFTVGRIPPTHFAHLDPDINRESLSRCTGWRPIFGQTGAAQGHLRNNGVQKNDLFLFFGLFQNAVQYAGEFQRDRYSPRRHVLWGWLQIDEVLKIDVCAPSAYEWARYHPHFHRGPEASNTLYIAREHLMLSGDLGAGLPGAGVFPYFSDKLALTAPDAETPGLWELPQWFYPRDGKCPLTFHSDLTRWERADNGTGTRLNVVAKGQEFILDAEEYPEAIAWVKTLLANLSSSSG
jgi:hypothetical protein